MRLNKLRFHNFGPFYGDQELDFGEDNGVTIIYGRNNFGKTTLLNSVRWLFVGKFRERTGETRANADLVNRKARKEAPDEPISARVIADLTWKDTDYILTRTVTLDGSRTQVSVDVIRGVDALSREQSQALLQSMIPEDIQQFFLFDAEDLNRYEDLLHHSSAGEELKGAIERILGVPVLKNGVSDLRELSRRHNKIIAKLQTADAAANSAANSLAQLNEVIDRMLEDKQQIEDDIEEATAERERIETELKKSEIARRALEQHRLCEAAYHDAHTGYDNALEAFQLVAPHAWVAVATARLEQELSTIETELTELVKAQRQNDRATLLAELRAEIDATGNCPCCGQPATNADHDPPSSGTDLSEAIATLRHRRNTIQRVLDSSKTAVLRERQSALQTAEMILHDKRTDLREAEEEVEDFGELDHSIADMPNQLNNTKLRLAHLQQDLSVADNSLTDKQQAAHDLGKVVAEQGGEEGQAATRKQQMLTDLEELLDSAIATYRNELKNRVETEATEVFLQMRSNPDFIGLSINDDYGLAILNNDGELEPQRSSGYEHMVALALVAALQRCAPVQAPIFMDMPFARLDPEHKITTLEAMPSVAAQIVLFVHEGEVNHAQATQALGQSLVVERKLLQHSSRHTQITTLEGG